MESSGVCIVYSSNFLEVESPQFVKYVAFSEMQQQNWCNLIQTVQGEIGDDIRPTSPRIFFWLHSPENNFNTLDWLKDDEIDEKCM